MTTNDQAIVLRCKTTLKTLKKLKRIALTYDDIQWAIEDTKADLCVDCDDSQEVEVALCHMFNVDISEIH